MSLQAQATHKLIKTEKPAISVTVDGRTLELTHAATTLATEEQIKTTILNLASTSNVQLPEITVHRNRDGSLTLATGSLPKYFLWPEDDDGGEREAP